MARRLPHFLTSLSLMLCIAAALLWVRSGGEGERFGWRAVAAKATGADKALRSEYVVRSVRGVFQAVVTRELADDSPVKIQPRSAAQTQPADAAADEDAGFFWTTVTAPASGEKQVASSFGRVDEKHGFFRTRGYKAPYWLLVVITGFLPVRSMINSVRDARRDSDLNADPDYIPLSARLLQAVASFFVVVALLLTALWVRSWYVGDRVSWGKSVENRSSHFDVHSGKGEFVLHRRKTEGKPPVRPAGHDAGSLSDGFHWSSHKDATVGYTTQAFAWDSEGQSNKEGSFSAVTIAAPFWALVLLSLIPPLWWVRRLNYGPMPVMTIGAEDHDPSHKRIGGAPAPYVNQRPL